MTLEFRFLVVNKSGRIGPFRKMVSQIVFSSSFCYVNIALKNQLCISSSYRLTGRGLLRLLVRIQNNLCVPQLGKRPEIKLKMQWKRQTLFLEPLSKCETLCSHHVKREKDQIASGLAMVKDGTQQAYLRASGKMPKATTGRPENLGSQAPISNCVTFWPGTTLGLSFNL